MEENYITNKGGGLKNVSFWVVNLKLFRRGGLPIPPASPRPPQLLRRELLRLMNPGDGPPPESGGRRICPSP